MGVIATCGCRLEDNEGLGTTIAVKDYCKDGSRCVAYPTLCNKCLKWYRSKNLELKTEKDRERWLKGKLKY